ncbi:1-propanol dehydrogenase PduQ [Enterococcus gilvus]|uniref:1-propanol dehydrogenase PduQ n=1 Tax=Enterococcus gilvus TaxID=160453 RepID=UPI0019663576|nr:1-propanol dehydrogenase PduQ [Enterococcus gilvus]
MKNLQGKTALIISDKILEEIGYVEKIKAYLTEAGITSHIFTDVRPDPDTKVLADGLKVIQRIQPDILVSMGGGSAIDAAKGIFYSAHQLLGEAFCKPYFVAIPTTSGTGSEVTDFSVITAEGDKIVLVDDYMAPDLAILDSDCVASVPKKVVVDTGMDVLTHATEAYVAKDATDFTDALAEKAIRLLFENLPLITKDISNEAARDHVHNASCMAGIAFNQAGLGINHSLAHAVGGTLHLAHGRCNALFLEEVIAFNGELEKSATNYAAIRYAKLAELLGLPARTVREGLVSYIDAVKKLKNQLAIESGFADLGIEEEVYKAAIDKMAEAAMMDRCTPANPIKPTKEELIMIYKKVY